MRAARVRFDDSVRRTHHEPESGVSAGSPPICNGGLVLSGSRAILGLLLSGILLAVLSPACFAAGSSDVPNQNGHIEVARAARNSGVHARSETPASHPSSLIDQVRFNQKPISFEKGVTVGPGAGNLEIQFATPAAGSVDRLRYRLIGLDPEWREAGKERAILHFHLAPGHYEFDFQAESRRLRSSVVESIPITVTAPYWQPGRVKSLCVVFLLFLILLLHKLRVRYLNRHNRKLQETVTQTRAELTLTARTARDAQEALKEQALKDGLTGLWNRKAIFAVLEREVYRARRDRCPVTLVMIDLDHFKNINDTYGHPVGDEVLRESVSRLIDVMRPYDSIGRYGGEEFLVVLPSCSPQNGVPRAEEFRRAIAARPVFTAAGQITITCSIGVAAYDDAMPPDVLIHRADEALYRAKRMGRNCVCAGIQGKGVERVDAPRDDHARGDRARAG
jgi:diguanylate cyclase (GGDEF)-like protein